MLRADLHLHSSRSGDCLVSLEDIITTCQKRGIDCVALTDHGQIEASLRLAEIAPFRVITGEEIKTGSGEVIGLFIKDRIEPHLPLEETVRRIKEQGGLVYVPHPFDRLRRSRIDLFRFVQLVAKGNVDIIEGCNARTTLPIDNTRAARYARQRGVAVGAGSDAHSTYEIGRCYVELEEFQDKDQFLRNLRAGTLRGHINPMFVHVWSLGARFSRKLGLTKR